MRLANSRHAPLKGNYRDVVPALLSGPSMVQPTSERRGPAPALHHAYYTISSTPDLFVTTSPMRER